MVLDKKILKMNKKFIGIKTLENFKVKSDKGFIDVKNIMKTIPYQVYKVTFTCNKNKYVVECADFHQFIAKDGSCVFAKDLVINQQIKHKNKLCFVDSVEKTDEWQTMYDIQMKEHHQFYTNDILSHNTTTCAGYICHQTIFNKEYSTAVLANKMAGSREVLDRVKTMYEELPWFLQMGVKTWNKGNIELGNGSKIITSASSSSSIRGRSINCISDDTVITVRNKLTHKIEKLSIKELKDRLNENST